MDVFHKYSKNPNSKEKLTISSKFSGLVTEEKGVVKCQQSRSQIKEAKPVAI